MFQLSLKKVVDHNRQLGFHLFYVTNIFLQNSGCFPKLKIAEIFKISAFNI